MIFLQKRHKKDRVTSMIHKKHKGQASLEVATLIAMFLIVGIFFAITSYKPEYTFEKESSIEITSIEDNVASEGDFFLGSGSIEGKLKYFYTTKDEQGGYKVDSIPSSNTTIYMDIKDNENSRIETWKGEPKSGILNSIIGSLKGNPSEYRVHIPKGSLKENYNVDLKN